MMAMALRLEGYHPQAYDDGRQALEALLDGPHALAILDAHLPTVDGLAICRRVRASTPLVSSMPIILLMMQEDTAAWHVHWRHLQINTVLCIPFQIHELLAAVAAAIARGLPPLEDTADFPKA
jgi:DNA-binding response OmpR family regulator